MGISLTVVTCMSPTGYFIPPLLLFPRKNMEQEVMNGTSPGSIHVCHPSGWIQSEIFFPVVSSFHQTHKADKRRSCYLSTGRAIFTYQEPGGHYFRSKESCWHNLPPTSQQPQNSTLGWSFHGTSENLLLLRNWKMAPFTSRASHRPPNWRNIRKCIQANCNRWSSG